MASISCVKAKSVKSKIKSKQKLKTISTGFPFLSTFWDDLGGLWSYEHFEWPQSDFEMPPTLERAKNMQEVVPRNPPSNGFPKKVRSEWTTVNLLSARDETQIKYLGPNLRKLPLQSPPIWGDPSQPAVNGSL